MGPGGHRAGGSSLSTFYWVFSSPLTSASPWPQPRDLICGHILGVGEGQSFSKPRDTLLKQSLETLPHTHLWLPVQWVPLPQIHGSHPSCLVCWALSYMLGLVLYAGCLSTCHFSGPKTALPLNLLLPQTPAILQYLSFPSQSIAPKSPVLTVFSFLPAAWGRLLCT